MYSKYCYYLELQQTLMHIMGVSVVKSTLRLDLVSAKTVRKRCFWRQIRDNTFRSSQKSLFDGQALHNKWKAYIPVLNNVL